MFLDQDGVPTLVEAKRSTDPRIRREVVGQLIEYAANAQSYWTVQRIRDLLTQRMIDETEMLANTLGVRDVEDFWQRVKSNLQSGRLRLIFVADAIPPELKRMIEFLNVQMDPAEVLGIELPQYLGGEMQTIVPRLIGNTAQAVERKATSPRPKAQWSEESFFADLEANQPMDECHQVRSLYDWFIEQNLRIWWGQGTREGSFVAVLDTDDFGYQLVRMESRGKLQIMLDFIRHRPAFKDRDIRKELVDQLNSVVGIEIPADARRPGFPITALADPTKRARFLSCLESLIHEIREFHAR